MVHHLQVWLMLLASFLVAVRGYYVTDGEIGALQDLYDSTHGENWVWQYPLSVYGQLWNFTRQPVDPCDRWQGITCHIRTDNSSGIISTVDLKYYNLVGTLPPSLQQLRNVSVLDFDNNDLVGTIPASFNNMTWIRELRLSYNHITGTLPAVFFTNKANLSYLSLTANYVSGSLPMSFPHGHSLALEELFLNGNYLTGTIPETVDKYENLKVLFIGYNYFVGTVPATMYQLSKANRVAINTNLLTGTISENIGNLSELYYMYLQGNYFTGTIPSRIGDLSHLVFITMFENLLTGEFPSTVGKLKNLHSIATDTNYLTGTIPAELGDCPLLEEFNVYSNMFTGPLPAAMSQLARLQLILVQSNHFTGNLAPAFNRTAQKLLHSVDVSVNKFTGDVPSEAFGAQLLAFSAFQTCLAGRIPEAVCDAREMQSLVLDGLTSACAMRIWPAIPSSPKTIHEVTGKIPECIWAMPNLTVLHLSSNGLTGTLPVVNSYGNLSDLDLSFNLLSGPVPETLQGWHKLQNLNLKSNRFCGDITGTGNLHFSYHDGQPGTSLKLSENRFSGIIPLEILAAVNVDVVEGNMFSCTFRHYPPYNDPNGRTYICGSNLLYVSMASLAAVLGVVVLVIAGFNYVAYHLVRKYEMDGGVDATGAAGAGGEGSGGTNPTYWTVRARMAVAYGSVAGTEALLKKLTSNAQERAVYMQGLVVRMIGWQRQVDALIANEDYRHDKVTQLGGLLKEALLSDQDEAEGSAVQLLQGMDVASLKSANVPHLVQFLKSLRLLRTTAAVVLLVQLVITVPAFPVLKHFRGTFLYQYGWYMSGAFVSGVPPTVVIILVWFTSLSIVLYAIVRYIPSRKALNYRVALQSRAYELLVLWRKLEGSSVQDAGAIKHLAGTAVPAEMEPESPYTMTGVFAALSRATTINRESGTQRPHPHEEPPRQQSIQLTTFAQQLDHALSNPSLAGVQRQDLEHNQYAESRSHTTNGGSASSALSSASSKRRSWLGYLTYYARESVAVSLAAVLFNVIVVLSIKGLFVYALNSNQTSFGLKVLIELSLSGVDLIWSVMFVPFIITRLPRMKPAGKMILKIALLYFNSIVAPCLAIAVTDADCFNGMFVTQNPVDEPFDFSFCALYDPKDGNRCVISSSWETSIKYTPPFLYNFNCYSNVITQYSPVFLFSYCILSLCLPAASMYITTLTKRRWFQGVVPAIFWLNEAPKREEGVSTASQDKAVNSTNSSASVTHPLHQASLAVADTQKRTLPQSASSSSLAPQVTDSDNDNNETITGTKRQRRSRPKPFLFFPGFILASAIHHILVLITFGLMLPVLGLAIVVVMLITTTTWELVIGRYLTQSKQCNPSRWQLPENTGTGERSGSTASEQSSLTATPAVEDCSGGLDALCVHVACCARKCKVLIAYGSAAVFACVALDMVADTQRWRVAIWAPITALLLPLLLIAALKASRIGTADQSAYEGVCAQQATTETIMLMRGTVAAESDPSSNYAAKGSRFNGQATGDHDEGV
jgi:Leucine-rich repeat (LRR) protein